MPKERELPKNCNLPDGRLAELQIYKFLQAVRQEDFRLLAELTYEGVPNLFNVCEPKQGIFPLLLAVELGKISVIDKLFALGVDGNVCDLNGKTASMAAAELGFVDILDKLISYGCDLAQQDVNDWDVLCYCLAAETEENFLALQRCLEVDPATFSKSIAILLALEKAELGKIAASEILAKTPNPNVIHHINKRSALSYAAEFNPNLVRDILKKGGDVTSKDVKGWNAVHFAAKSGSADALEALSAFKANFDQLNSDGQNPFHIACQSGKAKIVKYLVQRGANPKLKDKKGTTARAMCNKKTLKEVKKSRKSCEKATRASKNYFP